MTRFRIALLFGFVVTAATTTRAQAQEFRGLRYRLPAGWTATDTRQVRVLTPRSGRASAPAIGVVIAGAEAATEEGSRAQMDSIADRWHDGLTVTDVGDILPTDLGADGTLLVQRFTVDLPDGSTVLSTTTKPPAARRLAGEDAGSSTATCSNFVQTGRRRTS